MFIQTINNDDKFMELTSFLEAALKDNTYIIIECIDDFEEHSIAKKFIMVAGCGFLVIGPLFVIFMSIVSAVMIYY